MAFTPDGAFTYVARFAPNTVSVINTSTNAVIGTIPVGVSPVAVAITPLAINAAPVADAGGDRAIRAGDTVYLDGRASYDDNTASADLSYLWSFSYLPAGSAATLMNSDTPTPSFVADAGGAYSIQLVVTDAGGKSSASDFVEISSNNLPPTAAAGDDKLVVVGTTVALSGLDSTDPENDRYTGLFMVACWPIWERGGVEQRHLFHAILYA